MNTRDPLLWILAGTFLVALAATFFYSTTNAGALYRAQKIAEQQMKSCFVASSFPTQRAAEVIQQKGLQACCAHPRCWHPDCAARP